jgi:hypothetical protein
MRIYVDTVAGRKILCLLAHYFVLNNYVQNFRGQIILSRILVDYWNFLVNYLFCYNMLINFDTAKQMAHDW